MSRKCRRYAQKLPTFWKKTPTFLEKSPTFFKKRQTFFLLSLEEIKRKLRCLSSTPRKQESKVVNQQILKRYPHARTLTRITAIFVFLLSQPSQKSLQLSMFQFIAHTFRTYFNIFWKTPRFFLLMSVPYSIAKLLIFSSKMPPKTPLGVKVVKAKSAKSQGCARVCAPTRGNCRWSAP